MTRTSGQEKILSDDALKAMLAYDWPGNVRELENCLERTYAFTSGPTIHSMDLPREIANLPVPQSSNGNGNGHSKIVKIADGATDHLARHHGSQWRQIARRPIIGDRQDHALSQAERLRSARVLKRPIPNSQVLEECHYGKADHRRHG